MINESRKVIRIPIGKIRDGLLCTFKAIDGNSIIFNGEEFAIIDHLEIFQFEYNKKKVILLETLPIHLKARKITFCKSRTYTFLADKVQFRSIRNVTDHCTGLAEPCITNSLIGSKSQSNYFSYDLNEFWISYGISVENRQNFWWTGLKIVNSFVPE